VSKLNFSKPSGPKPLEETKAEVLPLPRVGQRVWPVHSSTDVEVVSVVSEGPALKSFSYRFPGMHTTISAGPEAWGRTIFPNRR
jgi:hypothetical protein